MLALQVPQIDNVANPTDASFTHQDRRANTKIFWSEEESKPTERAIAGAKLDIRSLPIIAISTSTCSRRSLLLVDRCTDAEDTRGLPHIVNMKH
jgi:hypothetical protein